MKTCRALLLSGILMSLSSPSQAQVKHTQINALVEALRLAAPPNRPTNGMYSEVNGKFYLGLFPIALHQRTRSQ